MRHETAQDRAQVAQQLERTKAVRYTGHGAATGGLQSHSVGELYPLDVYGQETAEGLRYGVRNMATGADTGASYSIRGAFQLARIMRDCPARPSKLLDRARVAGWIASGATLAEVEERAPGTRAAHLYSLLWGWSVARYSGAAGQRQEALHERDAGQYARRIARTRRIVERLRHSADAYLALYLERGQ